MKYKIILTTSLMILLSIFFVSATFLSTTNFTNEYANNYGITKTGYKITYDITSPGWYLLPYQESTINFAEETDLISFYNSIDYKWAFSPFTKQYVACEKKLNYNPLLCNPEKIYNKNLISLSSSLSAEGFARNYRAYMVLSADWHYYSKPVKVVYEYQPFMLHDSLTGDQPFGLLAGILKSGWNLINFPAYLAYGDLTLGDCNFEEISAWDSENQKWLVFPDESASNFIESLEDNGEGLSGMGVAIKVVNDCTFLKKKDSPTPPIPQLNPN